MERRATHAAFLLSALAVLAGCTDGPPAREPLREPDPLVVGGTTIDLRFERGAFAASDDAIVEWVRRAALAVQAYYDGAPVPRFEVVVATSRGAGVSNGLAAPGGAALVHVDVGARTTKDQLDEDWVLTHEMLHLHAPDVGRRWFEEGLAVYAEPIARVRAGQRDAKAVLAEMADTYAQGLPERGDKGLDGTDTWARSYYGGALFFFVADIEIRKATKNARGLEHALRAIAREGGVVGASWTVDRALAAGDEAIGAPVLVPLAKRWRGAPVKVDLRGLFRELGVELRGREVVLHEDAPLAEIRRAIFTR